MATYGYARVSTRDQNLDRQVRALEEFGVDEIFSDKASGKDFDRPEWLRLMGRLSPGDLLVVKSIDKLGRDYLEITDMWRRLTGEVGADIVVLEMGDLLDTRLDRGGVTGLLISDMVLRVYSYAAQKEREAILRRQAEGIEAARARGVHLGRPRLEVPAEFPAVSEEYLAHKITRKEATARLGVSAATFDRWLANGRPSGQDVR